MIDQPNDKQNNYNQLTFSTHDLGCSAALLCAGLKLQKLDKINPRKVLFVFQYTADIDEKVDLYLANKLDVKARAYWDTIRALKNRLYAE